MLASSILSMRKAHVWFTDNTCYVCFRHLAMEIHRHIHSHSLLVKTMTIHRPVYLTRSLIIGCTVALLISCLYYFGGLNRLESMSYDARIDNARQHSHTHEDIAVIMIDEASLKALDSNFGRWPWPRSVYADLMEFFSFANPRALLFDINFSEKQLKLTDNEPLNPHDQALVEATSQNKTAYHAARLVLDSEDSENPRLLNQALPLPFIHRFAIHQRFSHNNKSSIISGQLSNQSNNKYYLPFNELLDVTSGIGIVDFDPDSDGVYRRARLFHQYGKHYYPSLSITSILDNLSPQQFSREANELSIDAINIPVDSATHLLVNFHKHYDNVFSFSGVMHALNLIRAGDIENLPISPIEFENKIVFIGASAAGLNDLKNTPMDSNLPGVLLHASIASNILAQDFLVPAKTRHTLALITAFSLITAILLLMVNNNYLRNSIPLLLAALFITVNIIAFDKNIVIDLVAPLFAIALSWLIAFSSLLLIEGKEKRRFKRMMSQYLSPAVLETVVSRHEEYAKAEIGSKETISILFSDIRNFTNMSEQYQPEKVVEILNYYFSAMTTSIFHHEGTIDKFIGDAIMAFWGAPIKISDHAEKSTLAALEMLAGLTQVNQWLRTKQLSPLSIGIGIHTGDAILGNIGSENKLDYTIIGDNVNLASRVEGLTKLYNCSILITENTYQHLPANLPCRVVDLVRVKGKTKPIKIFQPLVLPDRVSAATLSETKEISDIINSSFEYYLNRQWQECITLINKIPQDDLTESLINKCQTLLSNEPPANWDGILTMNSK